MEWFPALSWGWLSGWIVPALLALTEGVIFLIFLGEVVERLFDRSGWSPGQVFFTVFGKLWGLRCLVLLVFTPLKIDRWGWRPSGGLSGLIKALFDFRNAPSDQPVTQGIYRVSRHPQIGMSTLVLLRVCLAIGSGAAVVLLVLTRLLSNFGILAEGEACLEQYGEAYRTYVNQAPRYFIVF